MQPYNYSIDLPAPPADNFLQNIMGIAQLQNMSQQQKIAQQQAAFQQQMQPLEMQRLQEQIKAQQASTGLVGVQTTGAKLALADKQLISSTLQNYFKDETKTVKDLAPILPLLDATAVENLGKAEQIRVNNEVSARLNEGKEITASDIRGWSNRQTLLRGPEQQQFQQSFLAMTPQFQSAAKSGMINAVNAAFAGNMEVARSSAAEVQQALLNSKDTSPAAKAVSDSFGKIVDLIDQNPNIPKEILALNAVNAAGLVGDPRLAEDTLKIVKEFGDQTKPGGAGKGKEVDEEKRALDLKKGELDIEKERLQIQEIQQKIDAGRSDKVKIYASQNKEGYKLNEEARNATLQAEKARGILGSIDSGEVQLPKSPGASVMQWVRDKVPFLSNDISFLRTQYQALLAPEAKKNLPPGSASDADMRAAREGLLNKNATPKQFRKAVDIIARLSEDQAKYAEARLGWISENEGSIGTAVKDISVFGVPVKKGTPLNAWWTNVGKDLDLNKIPTQGAPTQAGPSPSYTPPSGVTIKSVR
jgi:hypothetical protein